MYSKDKGIMDKRIKMSEEDMRNYFIREQKVMEYGWEFFKEICDCHMSTETCLLMNDKVLPLSCYNQMDEYVYSVENGLNYAVQGGFVRAVKKQAYIRIGIDTNNSILNKKLKQTIRHEIIHYSLWLLDLPFDDDSLEFWCLCYIYDGGAYEELSYENKKYYEVFKEVYDNHVKDLPWNICHLITGQMITCIGKTAKEKYAEYVMEMIENLKKIYSFVQ